MSQEPPAAASQQNNPATTSASDVTAATASTTEPAETEAQVETEPEWEIEDYHAALKRLEDLQEKIDNLRTTIPTLASPLRNPPSSKPQLFTSIRDSASQVGENLRDFGASWRDPETLRVLERSRESVLKDGDLSRAVEVERWGWNE